MDDRTQAVQSTEEKLQEVLDTGFVEKALQSNIVEFEHKEINYRIRKPTFKEREETNKTRAEKQIKLLKEKDEQGIYKYLSEEDLRKLYKDRGVDINELEGKIENLKLQQELTLKKLGKALADKASDKELNLLKEEIETIKSQLRKASIKMTDLFDCSIEQQVLIYTYSYLTYLILEKKEGDKWIRAFKSYNEYLEADEKLVNQASVISSIILTYNE
jgi:hypothetical protein